MGRNIISEFKSRRTGEPFSVDFVALAKSFGFEHAARVQRADEIGSTIKAALDSNAPALVEVPITRDPTIAASNVVGWWDFPPVPTAPQGVQTDWAAGIAAEQHEGRDTAKVRLAKATGAVG